MPDNPGFCLAEVEGLLEPRDGSKQDFGTDEPQRARYFRLTHAARRITGLFRSFTCRK